MSKITQIEGIGPSYAQKLEGAGITTTDALLEKGASPQGRKAIAEQTTISEKMILRWVNQADLSRIKGVSEEYAELLESAGVDTVPELAQRNAENLHQKMTDINKTKKLVRKLPSANQVSGWIQQSKDLPRVVLY
jgi:predicted flap endonuclease-1-like 5' DNA nuclease